MLKGLLAVHNVLWGAPALVMILGVGLFLTVTADFPQVRFFHKALKRLFRGSEEGSGAVSPVQALCMALAGTVGTGNLVGVAGAICLGGPGAVFWMWICGFVGMATKFAEVTLAVRYRVRQNGDYIGGPMYMISRGLAPKWKWLAVLYSFLGILAAFGIGNAVQVNSVITGVHSVLLRKGFKVTKAMDYFVGGLLAAAIGAVLFGGVKRVGKITEKLVPFISGSYIAICLILLLYRAAALPDAVYRILHGAFCPKAVTGGLIGSSFQCLRVGCARGVFTNEAGMGTASIAHASARTEHPVEQGMLGIVEVFIDTILICSLTAFAILCSGVPIPYGTDAGAALTTDAFCAVFGDGMAAILTVFLCFFAIATTLGWGLYGLRCGTFLLGQNAWSRLVWLQMAAVFIGTVLNTESVWLLAETVNGVMVIPNLIALTALSPELKRLVMEYKNGGKPAVGGIYADFHQRKPLRTIPYAEIPSAGYGCTGKR